MGHQLVKTTKESLLIKDNLTTKIKQKTTAVSWYFTLTGMTMIKIKKNPTITLTNVGKDVENLDPSDLAGENVKCCSHCEKKSVVSSKW